MPLVIDLETLGVTSDAIVLSIGVSFCSINHAFIASNTCMQVNLDTASQRLRGRKEEMETIKWWNTQSKEVFESNTVDRVNVANGLDEFTRFYRELCAELIRNHDFPKGTKLPVYGNGSDFDCVILQSLYRTYAMECPFTYKQHRCLRTISNLFPQIKRDVSSIPHNALEDALAEAETAARILRKLAIINGYVEEVSLFVPPSVEYL